MKLKKIVFVFAAFALMISAVPQTSSAQWSLGASYEIRNENPKNGFGVRVERGILNKLPVIDLGLRAHFSYFKEEINNQNFSSPTDFTSYDYGVAAVAGVSVALITPYIGTGIGSTNFDGANISRSDLYWNGFVGAKVSPIPKLKPFVEYRYQTADSFSGLQNNLSDVGGNSGRLIFGISLSF